MISKKYIDTHTTSCYSFPVFAKPNPHSPRSSRPRCAPRSSSLTSISFPFILFADPHPLTTIESYRYKNLGGRVYPTTVGVTTHSCFKSFSRNTYGPTPQVLQTRNLRQTYAAAKPFRCNTYKKPGGRVFFPFWNSKPSNVQRSNLPTCFQDPGGNPCLQQA